MNAAYCANGHYIGTFNRLGGSWEDILRLTLEEEGEDAPHRAKFCAECGAKCLIACETCHKAIKPINQIGTRPSYCSECSNAFPWTEDALNTAKEYTDELEALSPDDKAKLKGTFSELTTDTARTPLAANRFRRFMAKLGPAVGDVFSKILVNVTTEAAKRGMGL